MNLRQLVDPRLVFTDISGDSRDAILGSLAERLEREGAVPSAADLHARLVEREVQGSTAIGRGVAIPHCKLPGLGGVVVAVGVARDAIDLDAPDRKPVRLFFLVISPESAPAQHLQTLAAISRWLKQEGNLERIAAAHTGEEVNACLGAETAATAGGHGG